MSEIPQRLSGKGVPELTFKPSDEPELIAGSVRFRVGTFLGIGFDTRGFGIDVRGIGSAAFPNQDETFTLKDIAAMQRTGALKVTTRQFPESGESVMQVPPAEDMHQRSENTVHWEVREA